MWFSFSSSFALISSLVIFHIKKLQSSQDSFPPKQISTFYQLWHHHRRPLPEAVSCPVIRVACIVVATMLSHLEYWDVLTWLLITAARSKGSFEHWHIHTYLSTPATDDVYDAGTVSLSQRTERLHRGVDEALGGFEKMKCSSQE